MKNLQVIGILGLVVLVHAVQGSIVRNRRSGMDSFMCQYGGQAYFPGSLIEIKVNEETGACVHVVCNFDSNVVEQPGTGCSKRSSKHEIRIQLLEKLLETYNR